VAQELDQQWRQEGRSPVLSLHSVVWPGQYRICACEAAAVLLFVVHVSVILHRQMSLYFCPCCAFVVATHDLTFDAYGVEIVLPHRHHQTNWT